ncbi:MAG: GNAT family N-acetyltransferase [Bacilli bacterium]
MDVRFKIATLEDVADIVNLCNECFEESTSLEYAYDTFKKTMNSDEHIYIVGTIDGKIVSHAKITIIPTMYENMNTYAILNHVCVKKEYRRHNIATDMLNFITGICKEQKCKTIELWSNNYREAAHACYKKYGFMVNDAKFFSKDI